MPNPPKTVSYALRLSAPEYGAFIDAIEAAHEASREGSKNPDPEEARQARISVLAYDSILAQLSVQDGLWPLSDEWVAAILEKFPGKTPRWAREGFTRAYENIDGPRQPDDDMIADLLEAEFGFTEAEALSAKEAVIARQERNQRAEASRA